MNCARCDDYCERHEYSANQWKKVEGEAICKSCVEYMQRDVQCDFCERWFDSENSLNMHMETHIHRCGTCNRGFYDLNQLRQHEKVHRPKTVKCPLCGEQRFGSAANAVAHVESGYCSGCRGKSNARSQIYNFVSHHAASLRAPMIGNGDGDRGVPDRPYRCTYCSKTFTMLSAQMNHECDVHGNDRNIRQLGW